MFPLGFANCSAPPACARLEWESESDGWAIENKNCDILHLLGCNASFGISGMLLYAVLWYTYDATLAVSRVVRPALIISAFLPEGPCIALIANILIRSPVSGFLSSKAWYLTLAARCRMCHNHSVSLSIVILSLEVSVVHEVCHNIVHAECSCFRIPLVWAPQDVAYLLAVVCISAVMSW